MLRLNARAAQVAGSQIANNNIPPMFRNHGSQESKLLKQELGNEGNLANSQESKYVEENKKLKEEILRLESLVKSLTETTNKFASCLATLQNKNEEKEDSDPKDSPNPIQDPPKPYYGPGPVGC